MDADSGGKLRGLYTATYPQACRCGSILSAQTRWPTVRPWCRNRPATTLILVPWNGRSGHDQRGPVHVPASRVPWSEPPLAPERHIILCRPHPGGCPPRYERPSHRHTVAAISRLHGPHSGFRRALGAQDAAGPLSSESSMVCNIRPATGLVHDQPPFDGDLLLPVCGGSFVVSSDEELRRVPDYRGEGPSSSV